MYKTLVAVAVVLSSSTAWATDVESVPNPRDRGGWVTDGAQVLDADAERRLDALADGLKRDVGVEVAVVTLDAVEGTPKAFATALFNHWGIGEAAHDNGLLVLLVMGERRLEMEVGIGLEGSLPDDWLGEMQATTMVPRFKAGDFGGGLEAGVEAVDGRLRAGPGEVATPVAPAPAPVAAPALPTERPGEAPPRAPAPGTPWGWMVAIGAVVATAVGTVMAGGLGTVMAVPFAIIARWPRKCPECGGPTVLLDDLADDEHLDEGQRAEERVGSVDWTVRVCQDCQHSTTRGRVTWFSARIECQGCERLTGRVRSKTLVHATYDHGGEIEKTWDCAHCAHTRTETVRTPRRVRPPPSTTSSSRPSGSWNTRSSSSSWSSSSSRSSSNRSSGSSFGGGRSRGGGKGSSW